MSYKIWKIDDALVEIKNNKAAKFEESIDVSLNFTFGSKKGVQLRGVVILPNGSGKKKSVAAIVQEQDFTNAKNAGADAVGNESIIKDIMDNKIEYDCYITTPSMIRSISSVAKILGPKGLMPSVKSGTVTEDFGSVIKDIKNGKKVEYKSDKIGGINMRIGSISFDVDKLSENLINAISYILSNKPDNVDKIEIKSAFLNSTMGKSYRVDILEKLNK